MPLFRPQCGGFKESMALALNIEDRVQLASILSSQINQKVDVGMIGAVHEGEDQRNGWDTHMVMVCGRAVGYMNCSFQDLPSAPAQVI